MSDSHAPISLLWPPDVPATGAGAARLSSAAAADLDLDYAVNALSAAYGYAPRTREVLLTLITDPAVISYRQDVLADLLRTPELADRLVGLLPRLAALDTFGYSAQVDQSPLHEVVWRIGQLESYVEAVTGLHAVFEGLTHRVQAAGWRALHAQIDAVAQDATFRGLVAELPDLLKKVRGIASITVGINLDDRLRPVEATLVAVNNKKYRSSDTALFSVLFGREASGSQWEGLAALHAAAPKLPPGVRAGGRGMDLDNPLLYPLFRDLADVLKKISRPVATALQRYLRLNVAALSDLGAELAFYLGALALIRRVDAAGLPFCRPEIAPPDARVCEIDGAYNLNLALRRLAADPSVDLSAAIVASDVAFGGGGRIFVLTGPNQGGKTTYTQAVGLAHVLAQAGISVPGTRARVSPLDGVYTHFPVEERPESGAGRLGEEARRLNDIFAQATRHSLILLNESLASTSPGESLYLAQDVVRALRRLGARAIYATHLHDLAAGCDALNAETPGDSLIVSLVSLAGEEDGARQTYRIVPGPPRGRSYAREIALRYGISFEQISDLLARRGLLDGDA